MKTCSTLFRPFYLSLALLAAALLARADAAKPPVANGGLQMSLNTAAYRVYAGDSLPAEARKRSARSQAQALRTRDTLVASVQLANRSPQDLTFTFSDEEAARRRFDFRVFNSEGVEICSSGNVTTSEAVETAVAATLRKRSKWSAVVHIPLQIDGAWLTPGVYTIEASLAGEPKIGATTLFEVAGTSTPSPQPELPKDTGIKGQVFAPIGTYETPVPSGVRITIEEIREETPGNSVVLPSFRWSGVSDREGRFQVNTPAGRFRVIAGGMASSPGLPIIVPMNENQSLLPRFLPLVASKEVEVTAGQFTEVRLDMKPGFIVTGTRKISSVSSVKLRVLPTFAPPAMIEVSAEGMVNTGGWSNGLLLQRGITPEGIIEFDFVANPPTGIVTQAFAPISAVTTVPQPSNFRGVRVFAQSNSKEAQLE